MEVRATDAEGCTCPFIMKSLTRWQHADDPASPCPELKERAIQGKAEFINPGQSVKDRGLPDPRQEGDSQCLRTARGRAFAWVDLPGSMWLGRSVSRDISGRDARLQSLCVTMVHATSRSWLARTSCAPRICLFQLGWSGKAPWTNVSFKRQQFGRSFHLLDVRMSPSGAIILLCR
jgi:hypothetical protein